MSDSVAAAGALPGRSAPRLRPGQVQAHLPSYPANLRGSERSGAEPSGPQSGREAWRHPVCSLTRQPAASEVVGTVPWGCLLTDLLAVTLRLPPQPALRTFKSFPLTPHADSSVNLVTFSFLLFKIMKIKCKDEPDFGIKGQHTPASAAWGDSVLS